jgi:hypothetical protein
MVMPRMFSSSTNESEPPISLIGRDMRKDVSVSCFGANVWLGLLQAGRKGIREICQANYFWKGANGK